MLGDNPAPAVGLWTSQFRLMKLVTDHRERFGWDRQLEFLIAAGGGLGVQLVHGIGQSGERIIIVIKSPIRTGVLPPAGFSSPAEMRPAVLFDGVVDDVTAILGAKIASCEDLPWKTWVVTGSGWPYRKLLTSL